MEFESAMQKKLYLPALIFTGVSLILVAVMPLLGEVGMANAKTADTIGLWVHFFGKFHPLFLHLPIGALMLVFMMELAGLVTKGKYKPNTTLGLFFASVTGVFAVVFGYFLYLTGGYEGELIEAHKRDGILFTLFLLVAFAIKYTADIKHGVKSIKGVYYAALVSTGVLMMAAGHHGGEISHGDPIDALPSKIMAKRVAKETATLDTDPIIYNQYIHPILEAKCISCHGDEKQKGALRLDSLALMLEGGEETAVLVPGDVKESSLITYLHLPMEDDLHMPPEGKTQMTAEEIQILEWWVSIGAPETARRSELEVTPAMEAALATLLTTEQREKIAIRKKEELAAKKAAEKMKATSLKPKVAELNMAYPGAVNFISKENYDLSFSSVSYRSTFGDADLSALEPIAKDLVELDLSSSLITDGAIKYLRACTKLRKLKLNGTEISDKTLLALADLPELEVLNVYETAVTDRGMAALTKLKKLRRLYVWNTKVSDHAAKSLEQKLRKQQTEQNGDDKARVIRGIETSTH